MAADYWNKFSRRRVSRRGVLKAGAGAATGLGVAGLGLAACGGDGEEGTPAGGVTPSADETPVVGGKATLGLQSDPGSLDPQQTITAGFIAARLHNPLHGINMDTQEFQPLVAESMETPDQQTYIWKLRPGVTFHDVEPTFGREVTAEDVVYSFERLKAGPTLNDRKLMTLYCDSLEAVDDRTFKFKTNRLFSPAVHHIGNYPYCVVAKETVDKWEDLSSHAAGCGAWILESFTRGERVRLRKNPAYFQTGRPFPDEEEWLTIPDSSTLWQSYKTGKLDFVAVNVDKFKRQEIEGRSEFQVVQSPASWKVDCYIRVDRPPFSDERVREALDIGIDRDDAIEKLYFGEGKYNGPIAWPLAYWALPQEEIVPVLKYDPEKATQLLSAAGYADGLTLDAPVMSLAPPQQAATVVADHYRRIGVKMNIELKELGVYLSQFLYASEFDITFFLNRIYMEPDLPLRSYYSQGQNADVNPGRSTDAEIDGWIEGIWEIFDLEEKREYVQDIQRKLLRKHGPMYPLFSEEGYVGYSSRMRGLQEGTGIIGWLGISYWLQ